MNNHLQQFSIGLEPEEQPRTRRPRGLRGSILPLSLLGLALATLLRIIYPNLYVSGGDMAGHILASMRLHVTPLLSTQQVEDNFFAQVFTFTHGYTTVLAPWLLYELVFNLFGVKITEPVLVYIHSFLGLLSLASIFYFAWVMFGERLALVTLTLLAVLPAHIGLSRVHVGLHILYLTFFYLSLAFLERYLEKQNRGWGFCYSVATLLYIGCDNAFPIGLTLHVAYVIQRSGARTLPEIVRELKLRYFNLVVFFPIALPVGLYLVVTGVSVTLGVNHGYLLRLASKAAGPSLEFNLLKVFRWALELLGPVTLLAVASLLAGRTRRVIPVNFRVRFLLLITGIYTLLFCLSSQIERNYIMYLAVPIALFAAIEVSNKRWGIAVITGLTLLYSLAVVYRLDFGFPVTNNYGSRVTRGQNQLEGIKTLGYLVRSGLLEVSPGADVRDPVGLFMDGEGAEYYLGRRFNGFVENIFQPGMLERYPVYMLAYRPGIQTLRNQFLLTAAQQLQLIRVGRICRGTETLIELYSNLGHPNDQCYPVEVYNPSFDDQFGSLEQLPRPWIGFF